MRRTLTASILLAALAGCSNKGPDGSVTGVRAEDAATMNGERSPFETSQDPPIAAETHYAAGQLAESAGDTTAALRQYKQALEIDPKHRKSLYRQAVCLSQLKKHNESVAAWRQYIDAMGGDARSYSNLGFCHELAGRIDDAESAYLKGLAKDPKSVPCRTNYGLMLARLGRTAEATLQLQAVLTPAEVHYNLASVLEHQGRPEAAKMEYRRAIQLDPDFLDAQARLSALQ
jgi:tetratricopeptide (TPR) repeat protein